MKGWVESMKVSMGDDSKVVVDRFAKVETMVCSSTTISRVTSAANANEMLVASNLEASYPPNVRLPNTPGDPVQVSERLVKYSIGCKDLQLCFFTL